MSLQSRFADKLSPAHLGALPHRLEAQSAHVTTGRIGTDSITPSMTMRPGLLEMAIAHMPAATLPAFSDPARHALRKQRLFAETARQPAVVGVDDEDVCIEALENRPRQCLFRFGSTRRASRQSGIPSVVGVS
jgi:hypothetical protein